MGDMAASTPGTLCTSEFYPIFLINANTYEVAFI